MAEGLISDMERAAEIVSDWAVETILSVYKIIAPDGRPWDTKEQTMDERLNDYMKLRGNQQAWDAYKLDSAQSISQKLMDSSLPDADILGVHPFDIASKLALEYSVEMEDELRKRARGMVNANS